MDTSTWLVPAIRLSIPSIGADMDKVTESAMATAVAQAGSRRRHGLARLSASPHTPFIEVLRIFLFS